MKQAFKLSKLASLLVTLAYPFIIYFCIRTSSNTWSGALLFTLLVVQFFIFKKQKKSILNLDTKLFVLILSFFGLSLFFNKSNNVFLYYPLMMNTLFFVVFSKSLIKERTPIIESIATLMDGPLSQRAILYTRKVTIVWVVFFLINGSISLFTALSNDLNLWLTYNSFLSYCLMGVLFFVEYLYRTFVVKKQEGLE